MVSKFLSITIVFLLIIPAGVEADLAKSESKQDLEENTTNYTTASAEITAFTVDSGTYEPGETVQGKVRIRNTGNTSNTFFVGFSAQGPDMINRSNEARTGTPVTLSPNSSYTIDVAWVVGANAPSGDYNVISAIWLGPSRNNLTEREDTIYQHDVFVVEKPSLATILWRQASNISAVIVIISALGGFLLAVWKADEIDELIEELTN